MTKENFTAIAAILDASGSMHSLTNDTIGSFNQFLADQKAVPGEARLSLCIFNSSYRLVHDFVPLAQVPNLDTNTYHCDNSTALLDAIGTTIDALGAKLAALPEEERPSKVIVLVITDGFENASREYIKPNQVRDMVTHQREKYSWEFVYIGAGMDAITATTVGTSLGVSARNSVSSQHTAVGTRSLYANVSGSMTSYRMGNSSTMDNFLGQQPDPAAIPTGNQGGGIAPSVGNTAVLPVVSNPGGGNVPLVDNATIVIGQTHPFDPGHPFPAKK